MQNSPTLESIRWTKTSFGSHHEVVIYLLGLMLDAHQGWIFNISRLDFAVFFASDFVQCRCRSLPEQTLELIISNELLFGYLHQAVSPNSRNLGDIFTWAIAFLFEDVRSRCVASWCLAMSLRYACMFYWCLLLALLVLAHSKFRIPRYTDGVGVCVETCPGLWTRFLTFQFSPASSYVS